MGNIFQSIADLFFGNRTLEPISLLVFLLVYLRLDTKIFFLTIKKVFVREGISQDGQATMEVFNGNN